MGHRNFEISGRLVGEGAPTYVIGEMSANHAGSFEEAAALVRIASDAGADAVKLQTYTADTMTIDADTPWMTIEDGLWAGRKLYELYDEAHTPWEWQPELRKVALEAGIELFSTAFDTQSVEFLESMGVPVHKVASFEIVDHELIGMLASTGKPLIISTGMSTLEEITEAVEVARSNGARQIAVLKCTSAYPASPSDLNLRAIPHLREVLDVEVGFSDHTLGIEVPIAAVAAGASIIEKHFIRSHSISSADSAFSIDGEELGRMVDAIRNVEQAMGQPVLGPSEEEKRSIIFRRSIFAVQDIVEGDEFTRSNVRVIRPGHGIAPKHLVEIIGRRSKAIIKRGTPLTWDMVDFRS